CHLPVKRFFHNGTKSREGQRRLKNQTQDNPQNSRAPKGPTQLVEARQWPQLMRPKHIETRKRPRSKRYPRSTSARAKAPGKLPLRSRRLFLLETQARWERNVRQPQKWPPECRVSFYKRDRLRRNS